MVVSAAHHLWGQRLSDELRQSYRRMYRPEATMINAEEVIAVLNRAGVRFVLMGAHAIAGWRAEPRSTPDVDILVQKRDQRKAVTAVRRAYPDLTVQDLPVVTRFLDPVTAKPVIDLMKPLELVHQAVFKNVIPVEETHRIPDLEMALVCKFAAMISPNRQDAKKHIDAADFIEIVRTHHEDLDPEKLRRLGETVYPGGGDEVVKLVEDVKAGRRLVL
jgi:hypothetical protein